MTTYTWNSDASGSWSIAANWVPISGPGSSFPSASDTALITQTGTDYIVTIAPVTGDGVVGVSSLQVGSANADLIFESSIDTLAVGETLVGILTISNGTVDVGTTPATITIASTSTLAVGYLIDGATATGTGSLLASGGTVIVSNTASTAVLFDATETFNGGTLSDAGGLQIAGGTFSLSGNGAITVAGLANFTGGSNTISGGTFDAGTVTLGGVGTSITLSGGTLSSSSGGITIGAGDTIAMSAVGVLDGTIGNVTDDGTIIGSGTVAGPINGTGTVLASDGVLTIEATVTPPVTLDIDPTTTSTLALEEAVRPGTSVNFGTYAGNVETLEFANSTALINFEGTIAGFNLGSSDSSATDQIDLRTLAFTGGQTHFADAQFVNGNTLAVIDTAGDTYQFVLASTPTPTEPTTIIDAISDGSGGTDIFLQNQTEAPQSVPTVAQGTDYLQTGAGSNFNFGSDIGDVNFVGNPTGPGGADTIVERQADATINSGSIPIQIEQVDLLSAGSVVVTSGNLFGIAPGTYDISASLDPTQLANDVGTMQIAGGIGGGTWINNFNVYFDATFTPVPGDGGTLDVVNLGSINFAGNGSWAPTPTAGAFIDFGPDDGSSGAPGSHTDTAANVHSGLDPNEVDFFIVGTGTHVSPGHGVHQVMADPNPCFVTGTRILSADGEVAVEDLKPGDLVVTVAGGDRVAAAVKWIGRRSIDLRRHKQPALAAPIRIRRDAFADHVPHRDLLVSGDHAIYTDGVLVCARLLVNRATIVQDRELTAFDYFHIELDRHCILFAEGLTAESYLDTGNRGFFANAQAPFVLHPDLSGETGQAARVAYSCAPLVGDPDMVRPIWQHLADWAGAMGLRLPFLATTDDPDLTVLANGRRLRAMSQRNCHSAVFCIPAGVTSLRLISRSSAPCTTRPWIEDRRALGIAVARIVMRDGEEVREIPVDHPGLGDGWWAVESDGSSMWRWTDGDAELPMPAMGQACLMEIDIQSRGVYLLEATGTEAERVVFEQAAA